MKYNKVLHRVSIGIFSSIGLLGIFIFTVQDSCGICKVHTQTIDSQQDTMNIVQYRNQEENHSNKDPKYIQAYAAVQRFVYKKQQEQKKSEQDIQESQQRATQKALQIKQDILNSRQALD